MLDVGQGNGIAVECSGDKNTTNEMDKWSDSRLDEIRNKYIGGGRECTYKRE